MPRSWEVSLTISSIEIVRVSPDLLVTVQRSGCSTSRHGGDIQFSGLYDPPSGWTSTDPSALTVGRRSAGRSARVERPPACAPPGATTTRRAPTSSGPAAARDALAGLTYSGRREPAPRPPTSR